MAYLDLISVFGIDDLGGFLQPEQFCLSPLSSSVPSWSFCTLD